VHGRRSGGGEQPPERTPGRARRALVPAEPARHARDGAPARGVRPAQAIERLGESGVRVALAARWEDGDAVLAGEACAALPTAEPGPVAGVGAASALGAAEAVAQRG